MKIAKSTCQAFLVLFLESLLLSIYQHTTEYQCPHSGLPGLGNRVDDQDKNLELYYMAALMEIHALRLGSLLNTSAACCMNALILPYVLGIMACYVNNCSPSLNY